MITVQALRKVGGGANWFLINEKEIKLCWKLNEVQELEQLVKQLHSVLIELNIKGFQELMKTTQDTNIFNISYQIFSEEYKKFLETVCEWMFSNGKRISNVNVYNFLRDHLDGEKQYAFPSRHYTQTIVEVVGPFIDKLLNKLTLALKNKEKEYFWKLCEAVGDRISEAELCEYFLTNYKEDFETFIDECGKDFIRHRVLVGYLGLYNYVFNGSMEPYISNNRVKKYLDNNDNIFRKKSLEIYAIQHQESKKWKYRFEDDEWKLYSTQLQIINTVTLDFSYFDYQLKKEVKQYCQSLLKTSETHKSIRARLLCIRRFMEVFNQTPYQINSFLDLNFAHVQHIFDALQNVRKEDGDRKYRLTTIKETITEMKLFYQWLLEESNSPQSNPFMKIQFHNVSSFSEKTNYIPEEVIEAMQSKLDELPEHVKNIWVIMMHSGMRVSEALALEEDCLYFDEELNHLMLRYIPFKNLKHRERKGLDKYHTIPAKEVLVQCIINQIEQTKALRQKSGIKEIFITEKHNRITRYSPKWIANHINNLIEKHQIRDNFGNVYHYTHHQCRKTVTTELISKGATLEEVADFIGHLSTRTTERHYNDMQLEKIAELDAGFFEIMFNDMTEPEVLEAFSPEEKKALIQEIKLGSRETPEKNGICIKHISFGPCVKKSCMGCRFLTTGPQYLPNLYRSRKEQADYLKDMENDYKARNITDYENYIEYQRQKERLSLYDTAIKKSEEKAREVGMKIEKPADC
ncbi:tyrosine-type recombinase/integrase [Paenibacillus naphthalenovorans]|uniref:Phage integrase n=1 Tax=Paenibacillus naphthalenovorans TaxID=162209 RepID=A0A0U2UML2_9BACL|nr:site-specific integrase [Paenibacillus naphthalenovorans]ALS23185.1 phage integrase [Paenibacillus naphthalenovorans]